MSTTGQNTNRITTRRTQGGGVPVIEITGPAAGPHVLITAGVHGDEYEPIRAVHLLHQQLSRAAITGRVMLIPTANPTAFALRQRCGEDGLDMARTFPGAQTGSATQRAAADVAQLIGQSDAFIDLHTGGMAFDIHPFSGYMLVKNPDVLDKQRNMARAFGLATIWGTTAALDGRSLSIARDAQVPAIYAEFGGGGGCREHIVDTYVRGCLNVLAAQGVLAHEDEHDQEETDITHWVEDDAPDSGHLQLSHPAPVSGLFEAAVRIGQTVAAGERLGQIVNLETGKSTAVHASHSGVVIVLHHCPAINQGDAVAVILDINHSQRRLK